MDEIASDRAVQPRDDRVFDRLGNIVFETSDLTIATETGWDGTKDGHELSSGVYSWLVNGILNGGGKVSDHNNVSGNITLIR